MKCRNCGGELLETTQVLKCDKCESIWSYPDWYWDTNKMRLVIKELKDAIEEVRERMRKVL